MSYCELCGSPLKLVEGTSKKSGKPFKGWFCSKRGCQAKPQFIHDEPIKEPEAPKPIESIPPEAPKTAPNTPAIDKEPESHSKYSPEDKQAFADRDRRIARENALAHASALAIAQNKPDLSLVFKLAEQIEAWIYREDIPNQNKESENPSSSKPIPNDKVNTDETETISKTAELPMPFKAMLIKFARAKANLGDKLYYKILGEFGFEHCNEIRTISEGETILTHMRIVYSQNQDIDGRYEQFKRSKHHNLPEPMEETAEEFGGEVAGEKK